MAQIETWLKCDLKQAVHVQMLHGVVFSADNAGNKVGVEVFNGAEPVALTGGITGYAIRSDGNTLIVSGTLEGKAANVIRKGEPFTIPAGQIATLEVDLSSNLSEAYTNSLAVGWNFNIDSRAVNYTGRINIARQTQRPEIIPGIGAPVNNTPPHFFAIGEPILPETLPATGFPTAGNRKPLAVQPDFLRYEELDGLHLDIPVINSAMDLVRVPLNENSEWAVEWLTNQAGVLSSSALPGKGTSLVAAHNHLDEMNVGPFLMLWQLQPQDRLFITDNNGELLVYSVYANELFEPSDSNLIYQKAIPGSLVLMTCEEEMPEGGYAYRRIVFAEPLQ